MSNQRLKPPNAQKHGAYASTLIVPGEDPQEFQDLYSSLAEERIPVGATEEDAVLSIAKAVWRKRRVQKFLEAQLLYNRTNPGHASYNESESLQIFRNLILLKPDLAFEEHAPRLLRPDKIQYLEQRVPRSKFETAFQWAVAVVNEIDHIADVVPSALEGAPRVGIDLALLLDSSGTFWGSVFKDELSLDERLDAMIDRAVKRLMQMKTMKQMFRQTNYDRVYGLPSKATMKLVAGAERIS
jgi:hypothetical protein